MFTRRKFVVSSIGASLASPAIIKSAFAAEKSIKLCNFYALSGATASTGKTAYDGARLAIEKLSKDYGMNVEQLTVDSEGNPGRLLPKIINEIQNGTRLFCGGSLSSESLAIMPEVQKAGGVYTAAVGADEVTGKNCNRATFRWLVPTYGAIQQTIGPLIQAFPNAKRWYTITPKYVFGEALLSNVQALLKEKGLEHVGNSYHSFSESEFSGYLTNAVAAKPDVLVLLNYGSQSSRALRQAIEFGLKDQMKIVLVWSGGLEQYEEIGADLLSGIYLGCQYDHQIDTATNKKIVEFYQSKLDKPPTYSHVASYIGNFLIMEAVNRAGTSDPAALIKTLEGMKYEGPTGEEEVRVGDHQCIKDYYLLRGKEKSKMKTSYDYVDLVSHGRSFLPVEETGCKMT
jgi:branched-chain amino acid transport system substrate-binding protein